MKEINVEKHQSRKVSSIKTQNIKVWEYKKASDQSENFELQQMKQQADH